MADRNKDDLGTCLHEFAIKRMHFRPQGRHINTRLPSVDDFKSVCRGQMVDIWNFVLDHVHPAQKVRTVQGNLMLKSRQASRKKTQVDENISEEKAVLLERRRALTAELTSTLTSIGHVERDLDRMRHDLTNTETSYRAAVSQVQDMNRKKALLNAHSQQVKEDAAKYSEITKNITNKLSRAQKLRKSSSDEAQYYSKHSQGPTDSSDNNSGLETACTRQVREACDHIGNFLKDLLQGHFHQDRQIMEKRKSQIWQKIEGLLAEHSVSQVLMSLSLNTQETTHALRDKRGKIDIKGDAEKLKFKYENSGHLQDLSSCVSDFQSVHQLLVQSRELHFQRFLDTQKSKNSTWKLQQRMQQANELVGEMMRRQYRDHPGSLEIVKALYEAEVRTSANRAALRALEEFVEEFRDKIGKAAREREVLFAKYQKIKDFKKQADSKQNLIRVLVKQNSNSQMKLDSQQLEIQNYIQTSMGSHAADSHSLSDQLKDSVITEVDAFARLALPYLIHTKLDDGSKVACIDLSVHRLHIANNTQAQTLQRVLHALEFPLYKAPECVLPSVVALHLEIEDTETALHVHDMLADSLEGKADSHQSIVQHIADLCSQVRARDWEQMEKVHGVLQKRISQSTHALSHCLQLKDTTQAWWDQPAQSTVPWVTVDDCSLQQWKDKWTVAVTRLRQHSMLT